jgi:hypothetical protein
MATVKDIEGKLNTHEAVCAERWKETIERIKRLELVMITGAGAVIVGMAGIIWKM